MADRKASQSKVPAGTYEIFSKAATRKNGRSDKILLVGGPQRRCERVLAASSFTDDKRRYTMLTVHEIGLIMDFRRLTDHDKEEILAFATFKIKKARQKKKALDTANIKRSALKILPTTERKSL